MYIYVTTIITIHSQAITSYFNQDNGLTPENAKITFLRYVYKWPTFGSAFFEVKVLNELFFCCVTLHVSLTLIM